MFDYVAILAQVFFLLFSPTLRTLAFSAAFPAFLSGLGEWDA